MADEKTAIGVLVVLTRKDGTVASVGTGLGENAGELARADAEKRFFQEHCSADIVEAISAIAGRAIMSNLVNFNGWKAKYYPIYKEDAE